MGNLKDNRFSKRCDYKKGLSPFFLKRRWIVGRNNKRRQILDPPLEAPGKLPRNVQENNF
jgi:hypothetical protein